MFGYSLNYLIDMESSVIVDVEATPTRISKEVDVAQTMIERVGERFALKPRHVAGDVAYGTSTMLGWLVKHKIDPHIPVWDQTRVAAKGKFDRADFTYDRDRDLYNCPAGKQLKTSGNVVDGGVIKYTAKRSMHAYLTSTAWQSTPPLLLKNPVPASPAPARASAPIAPDHASRRCPETHPCPTAPTRRASGETGGR
jgi:hypothetical protein